MRLVTFRITVTCSLEGVSTLSNDLSVYHLKDRRINIRSIRECDDLPVLHLGNRIGKGISACAAGHGDSLSGAGSRLNTGGIECQSGPCDRVGDNDIIALSVRRNGRCIVDLVVSNVYSSGFGSSHTAAGVHFDIFDDRIREPDLCHVFVKGSVKRE